MICPICNLELKCSPSDFDVKYKCPTFDIHSMENSHYYATYKDKMVYQGYALDKYFTMVYRDISTICDSSSMFHYLSARIPPALGWRRNCRS